MEALLRSVLSCNTIFSLVLLAAAASSDGLSDSTSGYEAISCRCLAYDKCWPGPQIWEALNSTVGGRLVRVSPPSHLESSQIQGLLEPVFAVDAAQASHVQSAVKFAARYNLRLAIKNTGHDYQGRNRAARSFGLRVHSLRHVSFHDDFTPDGCSTTGALSTTAVTVGAGVQWDELYQATFDRNQVIVGGGCSSVGAAGGYPQGGGHSPISPAFGLAADNVLQLQVVTANGQLVVANSCQNPDLFWALRGGGGGTFGVVVSMTHKTHPALRGMISTGHNFIAGSRQQFEKLMTFFVQMAPSFSEAGWSGYGLLSRNSLTLAFLLVNGNLSFAHETLDPLVIQAQELGVEVGGCGFSAYKSFYEWHSNNKCDGLAVCHNVTESCGFDFASFSISIASRLIPRATFEDSAAELASALVSVAWEFEFDNVVMSLVAGGRVQMEQDNAVNPAWRKALWLVLVSKVGATEAEQAAAAVEVNRGNGLLRDVTPGSGGYMNEGDYNEPGWQQSFFGNKYERLVEIKEKYDPAGLFVCHHCVGSEKWSSDLNCKLVKALAGTSSKTNGSHPSMRTFIEHLN